VATAGHSALAQHAPTAHAHSVATRTVPAEAASIDTVTVTVNTRFDAASAVHAGVSVGTYVHTHPATPECRSAVVGASESHIAAATSSNPRASEALEGTARG
jgi:hypothetical protein